MYGLVALVWPAPAGLAFAYAAAAAKIVGGIAIQWRRTEKLGAFALAAAYLAIAASSIQRIVATPRVYDPWGNFFEQFSLATGAALVYARAARMRAGTVARFGRVLVGACTVSFALEQAVYVNATASLVPKWIPPGQMFWAIATTVALAFAALALLANRAALPATRLLTAMLLLFGVLVWIPRLLSSPHRMTNWSETAETFAIAGAAWILADALDSRSS